MRLEDDSSKMGRAKADFILNFFFGRSQRLDRDYVPSEVKEKDSYGSEASIP